jgi:hypothetical protein
MDSLPGTETLVLSPEDFKVMGLMTMELARHIPLPAVLYTVAAAVARFLGDRHMWGPYLALAAAALFGLH